MDDYDYDNYADFNDAIDRIILSEDYRRREAYDEAFMSGRELGFQQGFPHGLARGASLASEVGFYRGFALAWKAALINAARTNKEITNISRSESASKIERQLVSVEKLLRLAIQFPKENTEEDFERIIFELRSRFKQMCSLLALDFKQCFPSTLWNQEVF